MATNRPWLSSLAMFGFTVNRAIERGGADALAFEDVYRSLKDGTLPSVLEKSFPGEFTELTSNREQGDRVLATLREVAGGVQGREHRKLGVSSSGMHLLLAFAIEAMQQRMWDAPSPERERMH